MKRKLVTINILSLLLLLGIKLQAQAILDNYITEGLNSNIVLQQKNITLEKALISLKEANSLFLPSVNFNGLISTAEGGRYSDLPVGNLVNPVYQTLNRLTNSNQFPTISNQQINFLPKDYYDTYFRTSMPLLNTDIIYNKQIEKKKIVLQEYEVQMYKRELVKNIKTAYFNYLTANEATKIYTSAIELLNRNIKVNQSLLNNGKGLQTSLIRAQSELENVNSQLNDAQNQQKNAANYFNFLLNRDLKDSIIIDNGFNFNEMAQTYKVEENIDASLREESKLLTQVSEINKKVTEMNKKYWVPKLSAFLDLGAQAVNFEMSRKALYYMVGVNATFPVFNGFRNRYKIQKSDLDTKIAETNINNTNKQLQLAANVAKNNVNTMYQNLQSANQRLKSAESYFKLIDKGYNEGVNSLIEYIDARNQLTTSKLQVNVNSFKVLVSLAELERETASYLLK